MAVVERRASRNHALGRRPITWPVMMLFFLDEECSSFILRRYLVAQSYICSCLRILSKHGTVDNHRFGMLQPSEKEDDVGTQVTFSWLPPPLRICGSHKLSSLAPKVPSSPVSPV